MSTPPLAIFKDDVQDTNAAKEVIVGVRQRPRAASASESELGRPRLRVSASLFLSDTHPHCRGIVCEGSPRPVSRDFVNSGMTPGPRILFSHSWSRTDSTMQCVQIKGRRHLKGSEALELRL